MKFAARRQTWLSYSTCAAALIAGLSSAPALGQDATAEADENETIIVTATRRAESVLEVPLNLSAISGAQIEEQGFGDISELAAFTPGLNIIDQGGRDGNRIIVRGLNVAPISNAFGQEDGGGLVATYVGDIPYFIDLRLNDLERVETLLGPQGTLYGAGTMGGAIRYIPNKPDFDGVSFQVRTDAYTYSEGDGVSNEVGLTANFPVSERFALRGSIDRLDDQGFIDQPFIVQQPGVSNPDPDFSDPADVAANLAPLDDVNTEVIVSGRLAARWQPIEAVDATLTYFFQSGEYGGRNISGRRGTLETGDYESPTRVLEPYERDNEMLTLEVIADLGFAELTSASGLIGSEANGQRDQTDLLITLEYSYETFPTFTAFTFEDEESEIFSQELRLVSTADARYNWIVGAFYNKNEYRSLSSEFTPGYGAFAGLRTDLDDLEYFSSTRTETEETAVFGEVGFDITDKWDVTFGGRYYDYTDATIDTFDFPLFTSGDPGSPDFFEPFTLGEIDANVSLPGAGEDGFLEDNGQLYKVNTSYTFDGGNLIYATFSQGYRFGGDNSGAPCESDFMIGASQGQCLYSQGQVFNEAGDVLPFNETGFESDTVNNYEIGAKTSWIDGDLILTGSVFYLDWGTPQLDSTSINASTGITVNVGAAESIGFDVASEWQATDRLNVRGAFSFVDAELTEGAAGVIRTISPPGFSTLLLDGEAGDTLPGAPETQYSVFATYEQPVALGTLSYDFGYSWQDEVETILGGRGGRITLPSYGRANAAISLDAGAWTVSGYAENLFDEFAESSVVGNPRQNQTIAGANVRSHRVNVLPPRTLGVRLVYNWQE